MLVSHGPFEHTIPLAVVQKVGIVNKEPQRMAVQLEISNETLHPRSMNFSNLVYFTSDPAALDAVSLSSLSNLIRKPHANTRKRSFAFTAKDFVMKAPTDASPTRSHVRQNAYSNTYKMSFSFSRVSNLYVLVVAYREYEDKIYIGSVVKETILQNGQSPLAAHVHRLAETIEPYGTSGSIWPGPVHRHGNVLMAGRVHVPELPHPTVFSTTLPNYKIIDKRFLSSASMLPFDNSTMRGTPARLFSDVEISRGEDGMVHGSVSFDLLSYAKNNSSFGRLIRNNAALLSAFSLDDAIVYRRVVNPAGEGNSLTPSLSMKCNLQASTSYEPIARLGEDLRAIHIDAQNDEGIIPMSFVDRDVAHLNSGAVQYKLELMFSDKTHEAITLIRDRLLANVKEYSPGQATGWQSLIDDYLAAVTFVFGAQPFAQHSLEVWRKNLMALAYGPRTTKANHQTIIQTISAFVDSLSQLLVVPLAGASGPQDFHSRIYNSKKESYRRMEKILAYRYEIKDQKNVGISYVGSVTTGRDSVLPTIAPGDMLARLDAELFKYAVGNSNALSVNMYGYVSPESIRIADSHIETTTLSASTDTFSSLIRSQTSNRLKFSPQIQKAPTENKSNILCNLGITARPLTVGLAEVLKARSQSNNTIDSDQYLGSGSAFVRSGEYLNTRVSGSTESIIRKEGTQVSIFNASIVNDLVEKSTLGFKDGLTLTNSSVIEGSLALSKFQGDATATAALNPLSRNINFNSLSKLEYLKSYDSTLRCGKLNWQQLDERAWNDAMTNGKTLLCRLVKTSNVLDAPDLLQLQPLGALFALGAVVNIRRTPSYPKELARLRTQISNLGGPTSKSKMMMLYSVNTPQPPLFSGTPTIRTRSAGPVTQTTRAMARTARRGPTRNRGY